MFTHTYPSPSDNPNPQPEVEPHGGRVPQRRSQLGDGDRPLPEVLKTIQAVKRKTNKSWRVIAGYLECSPQHLWDIAHGEASPSVGLARRIADLFQFGEAETAELMSLAVPEQEGRWAGKWD